MYLSLRPQSKHPERRISPRLPTLQVPLPSLLDRDLIFPTARAYNAFMRRIVLIATVCLLFLPASAQMRSMGGGGMRGSSSFGPRGSTISNPTGRFSAGSLGFHFGTSFGGGFGRPFFGRHFHHHHRFFGGVWGYRYYGYPLFADYSYSTERPYYTSDVAAATYGEQARMEQRLDRIEERLDRLLNRLETVRAAPAQTAPQSQPERPPAATLVFRDGHKEEIQNYAVVGHTLWVFTEERARKIPLGQIDTEATDKANEQRGVDLNLPKVNN